MQICLELLGSQATGLEIPIRSERFVIGRDSQCDLRPRSRQVSRQHCELLQRHGRVFLNDLNSTNGTYLNESAVEAETPVHDGDAVRVGLFAFVLKISESDEAAPEQIEHQVANSSADFGQDSDHDSSPSCRQNAVIHCE